MVNLTHWHIACATVWLICLTHTGKNLHPTKVHAQTDPNKYKWKYPEGATLDVMSVYMTNGQLHRLFPGKLQKSGVNLVPLYQQKVYKMTILKLLHCLIPRSDAGIEKLVRFRGRLTISTVKKNKHFTTERKTTLWCDSDSFLVEAETRIRVCNHSNLLIKWAKWEFRGLLKSVSASIASVLAVHNTHFLQHL